MHQTVADLKNLYEEIKNDFEYDPKKSDHPNAAIAHFAFKASTIGLYIFSILSNKQGYTF
jgi:hypothetical protein